MASLKNTVIVPNSPVEFVISGPVGGRDRVLIRSEKAPLDLVGLVAHEDGIDLNEARRRTLLFADLVRIFTPSSVTERQLNVVSSYGLPDLDTARDSRISKYRFAWIGSTSRRTTDRVEQLFRRLAPELSRLVIEDDRQGVEWLVGPVILECAAANEHQERTTRTYRSFFFLYMASIALAIGAFGIMSGFKSLH